MNKIQTLRKAGLLLLIAVAVWGCGPAMPTGGGRPKFPGDEPMLLIPLPDAADDSATLAIVNTYKPIAIPFLTQWAQQQQTGVMIDLRADESSEPLRAEYLVQRKDAFSIPVIFVWDHRSSARAAGFMHMLESFSAVNADRIDGGNLQGGAGSCFQP